MAHIGIIGAGISGLTTALLLRRKGHSVSVFDGSDQAGGAMRTARDEAGWIAEWGPNTIIESSGRIKRLISILNLEDRRIYPGSLAQKRYIVRDHKMVAVPASFRQLLSTPLLSRSAKLAVLREPLVRRKQGESAPDESLADFVRRRLGEEFLNWPIDALVGGIYAGDPELLSVKHAFPRLALLEEQHGSLIVGQLKGGVKRPVGSDEIPRNKAAIFSFDRGLQVLPETLRDHLGDAVRFGSRVTGISAVDSGRHWKVTLTGSDNPPETFDALIYAGTAYGLQDIKIPEELALFLSPLTEIAHPPVVSLTLGFRREDIAHPLDGFGVLVPGVENFSILGTLFTSSLFPNRAPDRNHVTLTTYLGGMRQPEIAEKGQEEQVKRVIDALHSLLGVTGEPLYQHRILWSKAIPQYQVGYGRLLELMNRAEHDHSGFYLSGNYRTGISVGDSINAAFDLAERVHRDIGTSGSHMAHNIENTE